MGVGILRNIFALALLALALVTSNPSAAWSDDDEPRKITLYPFAEDAQEATAAKSDAPVKVSPSRTKSNFQPRFKAPATRRAAHTEPADTAESGASGPVMEPNTETADAAPGSAEKPQSKPSQLPPGSESPQTLLEAAYAKSKAATTEEDYNDIIGRCRRAGQLGLKPPYEEYSHQLMSWAYNRRGEQRAAEKHDKEALADFESAVQLNPGAWRAVHNRGVSYAAIGKTTEALADFDRTVQLNDRYPNAFFNRAQLRYAQGNYRGAADDYTAAIELGPSDPGTFNNRGHAFQRLERYGDALRDYAQALKIDSGYAPAMINRGDAYCELGRYGEAAKEYQDAVEADPKAVRGYQAAAWLMATCPDEHYRNSKLAVDAARKALALDGEGAGRDLETLAAAQANAGEFTDAKATQEKAIAKIPRSDLVAAEKRMGLYQRDVAFRQSPKPDFAKPEDEDEKVAVKRASAMEKKANSRSKARTRQAQVPSYPFQQ